MAYRHTQIGWVVLNTGTAGLVFVWWLERNLPVHYQRQVPTLLAAAVLLLVMILFGTLTTFVDREFVHLRFGPGLVRRKFRIGDIAEGMVVRNRWWMGWGIHRWPDPHGGWLFNVSGLDAVELRLKDGRVVRIGTDEPHRLLDAIKGVLGGRLT